MELQLKRIMREKGTDGKKLADQLGVSKQFICNVANGRGASIRMYEKLADLLCVPLWALFAPPTVKEAQNETPDLTMTYPATGETCYYKRIQPPTTGESTTEG